MYGGGVKPGTIDRELPIRPSAVRGQLRFWWRLLNRANRSSSDLFRAETELWGGISSNGSRASQVTLHVSSAPVGDQHLAKKSAISRFPEYVLILEQGDDPELLKDEYEFSLRLQFGHAVTKEQRRQVVEALRWWTSFSGVGARTRRGLGAIRVVDNRAELSPVSADEVHAQRGWMACGKPTGKGSVEVWRQAIERLKSFRQGTSSRGRSRRSPWPEADAIRRIVGRHAPGLEPRHEVRDNFPRAAFGLPIVFHFKDRGDPADHTLITANHGDRMASPLILRPGFDGERYFPLALLLPGWRDRVSVSVKFNSIRDEWFAWPSDPDEQSALAGRIAPMQNRGADPLSAFMNHFEPGAH